MTRSLGLFALLLVACQSGAIPGAVCAANGDCGSPLVCRLGRCRSECAANRDCPIPTRCLLDANHFGACSLDSDERCMSGGHVCAAGLICVGDTCANTCTTDADCPTDGVCRDAATTGQRFCFAPDRQDAGPPVDAARTPDASFDAFAPQDDGGMDALTSMDASLDVGLDASSDGGTDAASDAGRDAGPCTGTACGTATAICATRYGTCVIRIPDGRVICWGDERILGDSFDATPVTHSCGTGVGCSGSPVGVRIRGTGMPLVGARDLYCGATTVCATVDAGSARDLYCWGENDHGQLGTTTGPGAVIVPGLPGFPLSVVEGVDNFCDLTNGGAVWCWGNSHDGQLGTVSEALPPTLILSGQGKVALGARHFCYADGGRVYCRGADDVGQFGVGGPGTSTTSFNMFTSTPGANNLFGSATSTCGTFGADISCWGRGSCGELGIAVGSSRPLMRVGAFARIWTSPFSGVVCAQPGGASPRTSCWGRFTPTGGCTMPDEASVPMIRPELDTMNHLALGAAHWCLVQATVDPGSVLCAGNNQYGQLGRGTAENTAFPTFGPVCFNASCVP